MRLPASKGGIVLLVLLLAHLAIGVGRMPSRVIGRRLDEIDLYEQKGAARFLLEDAKIEGAEQLEWLLANTAEDSVVLWRWPADGALEFAAAVLAPRLVVDERKVEPGSTRFAGRTIAAGTVPSGERGLIVLQGTDHQGLRLTTRAN